MAQRIKAFWQICKNDGAAGGWICMITALFLLIGASLTPPYFIVDSSILAAVGEVFAFFTVFRLPNIIQSVKDGKSIKIEHNNTTVEVSSEKTEEETK